MSRFRSAAMLLMTISAVLAMGPSNGCNEQNGRETVKPPPAEQTPRPVAPEAPVPPNNHPEAQTKAAEPLRAPESQPATRPVASRPESTYSSEPPYPVSLFVKDPAEEQPGWLRIDALVDDKQLGTATGTFPEQNRIYVDTGNVNRVRIHVGHLPLRPNERVILQIDKQGMVLSRSRPFTTLERLATGEWVVMKEKDK